MSSATAAKTAAAEAVVSLVSDGMILGLGTGSTTALALEALGARIRSEGLSVTGVPTSFAAERLARQHGIPLTTLDVAERLHLAMDGADEVDDAFRLIKGQPAPGDGRRRRGGRCVSPHQRARRGAHAGEDRGCTGGSLCGLVDPSKMVDTLGTRMPLPVEVVPMAAGPVERVLQSLGAKPVLRMGEKKDGPVVTDQGFWVIDAHFDAIRDPEAVNRTLNDTPGVLDHGLFLGLATDVLIGQPDGSVAHRTV